MEDLLFWLIIICFLVIAYYIVYRWLPKKGFFKIEGEEQILKYNKREINFKSFMYGVIALLPANLIQGLISNKSISAIKDLPPDSFLFGIEGKWFPIVVALITAFVVRRNLSEK
tara:strand:- start:2887 stop:3228 length:342 start_codon:yes stop_codon:yes gene_type:complete